MTFKTLDQFKAAAQFFPAGRIIPQRILKGPRKVKHWVRFGSDSWALPTPKGYLIAFDTTSRPPVPKINRSPFTNVTFTGSPYGGTTYWLSNSIRAGHVKTDAEWVADINAYLEGGAA